MKEYRKRFVQLNMFLIGAVLLLVVAVIAVYMCQDYYEGLEATMQQVVEPLDSISEPSGSSGRQTDEPKRSSSGKSASGKGGSKQQEDREHTDIMTVFYTPQEDKITVLSRSAIVEEEDLEQVLEAVLNQEASFGLLSGYPIIYYRTGNGSPYKIALASTSYIGQPMLSLAIVLLLLWLGAMLCFLLVSIQLSKLAVRPMEDAMARERQFVADASHDLKTPLSVILANNSILRENPDATVGSLEKWIDSTQNAAKNMQRLIGAMLTLADAEREDVSLVLKMINVSEVVMKATLQLESVAYEKNVELETEIPEQVMLRANEDYLQRIAASLIENAIKYEPGGGKVRVQLQAAKHKVRLEVRNQGSVIPEEDLPHVFERFYRSDKSRQGETKGHGLGLAITKQMVERLGGTISVECGDGTTFSVVFSQRNGPR